MKTVGVVAIGRNEGARLRRCLTSLAGQCDRIIYVDSGSTDDSVAFARRIWKGTPARSRRDESLDANPQISRLEQAVEAIAIEVERISEAQRFSAKLLAERPVEPRAEQASRAPRSRRPVITPLP